MIGSLLEYLSPNTVLDTQHCPLKCHQRQFRCVKRTNGIEPPRDYLSVKKSPKKDPFSRLFRLIKR